MCEQAGARTPFAGLVVSGLIVLVLTCMAKQLEYIPKVRHSPRPPTPAHYSSLVMKCRLLTCRGVVQAVLGAVIEVAVIKLFDWAEFIHAFRVCPLPLPPLP
jgi:MFS superfamily sulfate permease-like transporter